MESAVIENFYIAVKGEKKSVIKFLVKREAESAGNSCTVCGEIPNDALKYEMIRIGSSISWVPGSIYVEIEGVEDVEFKKIGDSLGDEVTFYEHLKTIVDPENKVKR
ncbi:hypothetical protein [Segetibacter sp.]|jgi:hypothetical protein|uniref:hypothetical protein n=1 Tax=Segetibacter sp. TaxID=2231182 RepID=UPI00262A44F1|nr:hypothetical protein [Segetibacter sp.]MCW3080911.1 hypothetical protein [Segetibacter sp.]